MKCAKIFILQYSNRYLHLMHEYEPLKSRKRHVGGLGSLGLSDHKLKRAKEQQRSGKWTAEEEGFANELVSEFERGTLQDCEEGCTLRSYLARKLNCAPMRISKKFAGRCIGKLIFSKKSRIHDGHGHDYENSQLHELEGLYKLSCAGEGREVSSVVRSGNSSQGKPAGGTRSQHLHKQQNQHNMFFPARGSDSSKFEIYNVNMPGSTSSESSEFTDGGSSSSEDDELSVSSATASPQFERYYHSEVHLPSLRLSNNTSSSSGGHGGFNAFQGSSFFAASSRPSVTDLTSLLHNSVDNDAAGTGLGSTIGQGPAEDSRVVVEADEWRDVLAFYCGEDEFTRDPNIFDPAMAGSSPSNECTVTPMTTVMTPAEAPFAALDLDATAAGAQEVQAIEVHEAKPIRAVEESDKDKVEEVNMILTAPTEEVDEGE